MHKSSRTRKFTAKQSAQLGAYFAAGVGASMLATANSDAAIVLIDISAFDGPNGGLPPNDSDTIYDWAGRGTGTLYTYTGKTYPNGNRWWGLYPADGLQFAVSSTGSGYRPLFPTNLSNGSVIGSSAVFSGDYGYYATFQDFNSSRDETSTSPDFLPGSYMGFRFANGSDYNYGWLKVTWDSASTTWQVFSGAYEDVPGEAIAAGATAPIPEPGTWVAMAVLAGGAAFARWRKRRDDAA